MSPLLWTALGVALIALEFVVPDMFLIWFGGAGLATALAVWLFGGWPLAYELGLFAVLAGALIALALARARRRPPEEPNDINDRAGQLVGKQVTLADAIVAGRGRAFAGDTLWQVEGPDCPAGTRVRVTGHDGMVLKVRPAEPEGSQAQP